MTFFSKLKKILPEIIYISILIAVFYFIAVKLLPGPYSLSKAINLYDEGVLATGAKRLASGEIPYKDFWTLYSPLNFAPLAAAFKAFGSNLEVERIYNLSVSFLGLLSIYWLLRTKKPALFSMIAVSTLLFFLSPIKIVHLCLILTLLATFKLIDSPQSRFLPYICGILAGITFGIRLDFGILTSTALFITSIFLAKKDYKQILNYNLKFLAGFSLIFLPMIIWLALNQALTPFIQQAILYPFFGNYSEYRTIPFPSFTEPWRGYGGTTSFVFNQLFWGTTILCLLIATFKKRGKQGLKLFICAFLIAGSIPYLIQRNDLPHLTFINILSLCFLYYALFSEKNFQAKEFLIALIIPLTLLYFPIKDQLNNLQKNKNLPTEQYSFLPYPLEKNDDNNALQSTVNYLNKNIPTDQPIYIGLYDHSKIFSNNAALYLLIPHPIPTKYHELHTGVVTTAAIQKEIIEEISTVQHVVLWDGFYCESNLSCESSGVYLLDEYIKANFTSQAQFGKYQILKRSAP